MSELFKLERLISICIIQEDAEAIYSLLKSEKDPIFVMDVIPYYVLFVQSCQEYMGENFLPNSIAKDFKDIRNHIKVYAEGFGKSRKRVDSVDNAQDGEFRARLKYKFLKNMNVHLNLGTYWTNDHHVIGNTQQLADFLSVQSLSSTDCKEKCVAMGCQIGSFVNSVREGFASSLSCPVVERKCVSVTTNYYYDINTNKDNKLFLPRSTKELNLFFLHLLCNMNFVKHVLRPLFKEGNIWAFRIEYVVSYYTLRALERLKNYCDNNKDITVETKDIIDIVVQGNGVFSTKLRNCLMHYNLENAGVITFENIDKPFYGIIENCFDGMSYQEYLIALHNVSDMIINYLESKFNFSGVKLEKL